MSFNDWTSIKLGELIESISIKHDFEKDELIFLNTSDVLEGKVLHHNYSEVVKMPGQAKKSIQKGDILFSEIRPKNKRFAYIDFDAKDFVVSTKLMVLRRKSSLIDNKFLYKLLTSDRMLNYLQHIAEGRSGTFPQITFSELKNIDILLPSIQEQIAIAKTLDDLDEKIEINNKINKKLEEMAQAIFKQWFIDFEFPNEDGNPYKSSGGEMVESELGMIPNGWRVKLLKDYCDVKKGLSYKGKHLVEDGVPMINLGNVNPGGGFRSDKCKFYDGDFKEQHTVKAGDIIIANTDMTQDRVILGSPILVPDFKTESIIFTHHLFAFRNLKIPKSFLYYYLKSKSFRERAESYATGTTVLAISRDSVLNINFVKANNEVLNKFDLITKSILDRIKNNNLEIEKLQKLRDTLLPKLMSGEIRVPME